MHPGTARTVPCTLKFVHLPSFTHPHPLEAIWPPYPLNLSGADSPLNLWGGGSEVSCFIVFFKGRPLSLGGEDAAPKFGRYGLTGWVFFPGFFPWQVWAWCALGPSRHLTKSRTFLANQPSLTSVALALRARNAEKLGKSLEKKLTL